MLKIPQARLKRYVNSEIPDVQAGFRKGRGTRDQIGDICWIIEKARVPEKHLLLLYWLHQSLWLCGSQQTVENSYFLKYKFVYFNWRLITLQYCIGFAIHHHESATGNTCSPSWTPLPPSSLPAPSLWVVPVHQPQASSIMHRTWTSSYLILMHCSCFWEEVLHFSILLNKEYVVDFFL